MSAAVVSSDVPFHLIREPELPDFVVRLRAALDAAAARHPSDVAVFHSYFGHERDDRRIAAMGWTSRLMRTRGRLRDPIDVYYDAFDDDVMLLGGAEYREWFPDDDPAAGECLADLDRIVDQLAADTLPVERGRERGTVIAISAAVGMAVGFSIGRRVRRR